MSRPKALLAHAIVMALCVEASVCPQTVRKYMRGGTLATMTKARLERAIKKRGLVVPTECESP